MAHEDFFYTEWKQIMKKLGKNLVNGREYDCVFLNFIVPVLEINGLQGALLSLKDTYINLFIPYNYGLKCCPLKTKNSIACKNKSAACFSSLNNLKIFLQYYLTQTSPQT